MDKSGVSLLIVSFFQEGSEKASFAASRAGLSPRLDEQTTALPGHARIGPSASGRVNQKVAP
jgi:hypothetical protein